MSNGLPLRGVVNWQSAAGEVSSKDRSPVPALSGRRGPILTLAGEFRSNSCDVNACVSRAPLDQLHRIAIGVGDPSGPECAAKKIMRGGQQWGAILCERENSLICVFAPKNDLGTTRAKARLQAVVASG